MRVLVTGAGGFVGGRLVPRLRERGDHVACWDVEVDVRDFESVAERLEALRPEAIVHLAALSFVPDTVADPEATLRVNYLGTRNVLEAAHRLAPEARVLVVSSGNVYGTARPGAGPFDETSPLRPGSPYARTKAAADLLARCYAERGLDVVRARPFNHTGAGRPDSFVESSLARQLVEIERGRRSPALRIGNLESVRDFLHVGDVVDAYLRLLDRSVAASVYNVASGVGRSIGEIVEALRGLSPAGADVRVEVDAERVRPTDRAVGDARRLREATGWSPRVPFHDTLAELLEAWRTALV